METNCILNLTAVVSYSEVLFVSPHVMASKLKKCEVPSKRVEVFREI